MLSINVKINYLWAFPSPHKQPLYCCRFLIETSTRITFFSCGGGGDIRWGQWSCPELQRFNLPHPTCKPAEGQKLTELPCWGHRQQHPGPSASAVPCRRKKGSPESSRSQVLPGEHSQWLHCSMALLPSGALLFRWLQEDNQGTTTTGKASGGAQQTLFGLWHTSLQTGAQMQSHNLQVSLHTSLS